MNKLGFRNTLILSISLLIVACLLISNIYSYGVLRDHSIDSVNRHSSQMATKEAQALENWFQYKAQTMEVLAKYYVPNLAPQDYVKMASYTKAISDFSAVLISLDDGSSYSTISSPSWENGVAITEKYDARKRPWYTLGKNANGQLDITDVYKSASSGKNLVSIVKSINGGVLLGDIEVSILEETVKSIDFPGAVTAILDEKGKALASNSPELSVGTTFRSIGLDDVERSMMASTENQFDYVLNGEEKVAFTHAINMVGNKKWYLFIGVDKSVAYKSAKAALKKTLFSSAIMVVLAIVICQAVLRWLSSPIILLNNLVQDLARGNGDLTRRLPVTSNDELGKISSGINAFIANLQEMMLQVSHSSQDIAATAKHLNSLTNENNSVLNEHRKETEQIVTALDEMSATSSDVANNTANAASFTSKTSEQAKQSQAIVQSTNKTVDQLVNEVQTTSENISKLGHDMAEITNVLNIIGDIADQTNLLALNAAIEAARAGEHGRGFAVVADEVRALAARTQTSTAEIESTLDKLRKGVNTAIQSMERTKQSCENTSEKTSLVEQDLVSISDSISQINGLNIQIATAAEQQSSVADELTRNMSLINEMVEKLSQSGHKTNQETTSLVAANSQLTDIVSRFKLK